MRVLVVEDSRRLRTYLEKGLRASGFAVDLAADGEEALWFAESNDYDVIVLDLMIPKVDGITVLQRLRAQGTKSQILILSAKDTVDDRVHGLDQGADDYLVKPFALSELVARLHSLVRRRYDTKAPVITIADLVINTATKQVNRGSEELELPPRLFALLRFLASRRGEVVSRSEIEEHIYDERAEPLSNVVDAAVCSLRKRIDPPGGESLILTRRGMGYMLRDEREAQSA
jgi:DNA-binding response OmpR family regulator